MRTLSAAELTGMRDTVESSFFDVCQLGTPTVAEDAADPGADPGADTYDYGDAIACGFDPAVAGEAQDGSAAPLVDAVLRLPVGTTVTEIYRVRLTQRHGETLDTAEDYRIEGPPERGPSALVLKLKRIVGFSVG